MILDWEKSSEPKPLLILPISDDERIAMSKRASVLAEEILALVAEFEPHDRAEWYRATIPTRDTLGSVNSTAVLFGAKYGKLIAPAFNLINEAQKYIALDSNDIWRINHSLDLRSAGDIGRLLASISADLADPRPRIPLIDRYRDETLAYQGASSSKDTKAAKASMREISENT